MYYIACCDDDGICFGYLRTDKTVSENPDREMNKLMKFKRKTDVDEICLQINMSRALLPNGYPFRVCAVRE